MLERDVAPQHALELRHAGRRATLASGGSPEKFGRGFTILELMVVLAIVAILTTLAAPSFTRLIQSNSMSGAVNTFLADMRYARSESIRRGGGVVMCRSDAPEVAAPTCGTGAGPGGVGWASGWIIFHSLDSGASGGNIATGDPVLRVQAPIGAVNSVAETSGSSSTKFRFTATGRLLSMGAPVALQFGASPGVATDLQRNVCVGPGGYARIAGNGTIPC